MQCYCGNKTSFELCCSPIISKKVHAKTPEQLMRSRYSAYATKQAGYLYETYAKESKSAQSLDEIRQWANQTHWLTLTIIDSVPMTLDEFAQNEHNQLPIVHFIALYIDDKSFYQMEEISRFIVEDEQWRYLDGEVISHHQLARPKRNEPCICNSNKKFKHCCSLLI